MARFDNKAATISGNGFEPWPEKFDKGVIGIERNGVILQDTNIVTENDVVPIEGALEAIKMIRLKGYRLCIFFNEPLISQGVMTPEQVDVTNNRMMDIFGEEKLFEELKKVDPEAASNILPNNARRIVRALEVNEITGKPFNAKLPEPKPIYDDVRIGLNLDREILDQKISIRVHNMFQDGLVDEVKNILDLITAGKTSQKALGYSQVIDFLKGNISIEEAIEQTISATKKYARRQISWFKRDPLLRWFQADDIKLEQEIIRMVS